MRGLVVDTKILTQRNLAMTTETTKAPTQEELLTEGGELTQEEASKAFFSWYLSTNVGLPKLVRIAFGKYLGPDDENDPTNAWDEMQEHIEPFVKMFLQHIRNTLDIGVHLTTVDHYHLSKESIRKAPRDTLDPSIPTNVRRAFKNKSQSSNQAAVCKYAKDKDLSQLI